MTNLYIDTMWGKRRFTEHTLRVKNVFVKSSQDPEAKLNLSAT